MNFEVINATTKDELLSALSSCVNSNYRIGAGYTDLIMELKKNSSEDLIIININGLEDPSYKSIKIENDVVTLGTLVTASDLVNSDLIKENYPVLHEAASSLASIQIRNSATVGGNICNASPSADMSTALVALQATCKIINSNGEEREEPLVDFIKGVRKTSLAIDEILKSISIPKNAALNIKSGFEKVGIRESMEIAIVSLAYHIQFDKAGTITNAGVSCGAVAPVIPFATSACKLMTGKNINDISKEVSEAFAKKVVQYANPITDLRASEWYRKEVLYNLCNSIFNK